MDVTFKADGNMGVAVETADEQGTGTVQLGTIQWTPAGRFRWAGASQLLSDPLIKQLGFPFRSIGVDVFDEARRLVREAARELVMTAKWRLDLVPDDDAHKAWWLQRRHKRRQQLAKAGADPLADR